MNGLLVLCSTTLQNHKRVSLSINKIHISVCIYPADTDWFTQDEDRNKNVCVTVSGVPGSNPVARGGSYYLEIFVIKIDKLYYPEPLRWMFVCLRFFIFQRFKVELYLMASILRGLYYLVSH